MFLYIHHTFIKQRLNNIPQFVACLLQEILLSYNDAQYGMEWYILVWYEDNRRQPKALSLETVLYHLDSLVSNNFEGSRTTIQLNASWD